MMALPIGSMIPKIRPELEAEIEEARQHAGLGHLEDVIPLSVADEHAGPLPVR